MLPTCSYVNIFHYKYIRIQLSASGMSALVTSYPSRTIDLKNKNLATIIKPTLVFQHGIVL